jgi:hypothetical protein
VCQESKLIKTRDSDISFLPSSVLYLKSVDANLPFYVFLISQLIFLKQRFRKTLNFPRNSLERFPYRNNKTQIIPSTIYRYQVVATIVDFSFVALSAWEACILILRGITGLILLVSGRMFFL